MSVAYINIGSNQGDRRAIIGRAVALIESACGSKARVSSVIESDAWGYESANRFLNLGIAVDTDIAAGRLIKTLLDIERSISPAPHRDKSGRYADRMIDIDLVAVDDMIVDTPELILPHPRMHLREFVLRPMAELAPAWRHPLLGLTPGQMLAALDGDARQGHI